MIDPLSLALGAVAALLIRWGVQRVRGYRVSEYPIEGSEWVIDGHRRTVRAISRDRVFFSDLTRITFNEGGGYSMPWREFRRRARPLNAEHLIQAMHRPQIQREE